MLDFIRIACAVPAVKPGAVRKNAEDICNYIVKADAQNVDLLVFPELALTGYTCGDLFLQDTLWNTAKEELRRIVACTAEHPRMTVVLGMPLSVIAPPPLILRMAAAISEGL